MTNTPPKSNLFADLALIDERLNRLERTVAGDIHELSLVEGSAGIMGASTLSGGTVVVSTTAIATGDRVFITPVDSSGTPGFLSYTISDGVSFTVTSTSGTDARTFNWLIITPV